MIYVKDIIEKCDGKLIYGDLNLECNSFSKDTRTLKEGDIYIGIKGEKFDGNDFYQEAFNKGASACILDKIDLLSIPSTYQNKTIIQVDDTLACIQKLAKYKRSLYQIPVIAVTGSVGKTSTKDMIASVLATKYKILKSEGNNNNHIGLPLTILGLKDEELMIVEMGMNNKGEISLLSSIAKPTIAVITNIGTAHIGNLGSRENIMKAKLELVENLNGPLIINNDNDILHANLDYIKSLNNGNVITIGIDNNSDYMATDINNACTNFKIKGNDIECQIGNTAFVYNSLVAYAIGDLCNVNIENIQKGIKNIKLASNRLEYKETPKGVILIDDTYNSSLDSIKSSLEILRKKEGNRKIAVIGDVLELGSYSEEIHTDIGKELLNSNLDYIVTIGNETNYTDKYLKEHNYLNLYHFANEKESYQTINNLLQKGNVVLLKGSHAMNLGNIVSYLMK